VLKAKRTERGSTVAILAASMIFMVAMAAIAIDVVMLYVVRGEAQRAADAAALAGAHQFVISGFTSGNIGQGQVCNGSGSGFAQDAAIKTAAQNNVGGQPGQALPGDVTCDFSQPDDPRITVKVTRQNLPTFFSRIWGSKTISSVSASATAEAFNESGHNVPTVSSCLKPFLTPNSDPFFGVPYVDVTNSGNINRPQHYPAGFVGEPIILKPAVAPATPNPGEFVQLLFTNPPSLCPKVCAGTNDTFQQNIQCCNTQALQCGVTTYSVDNVNVPNPTDTFNGTQCLTHADQGPSGADTLLTDPPPFQFLAGTGNPTHVANGTAITTSDSLVTIPLYQGALTSSVQPIGFLQVFIRSVDNLGNIQATIINVVGCRANGGTGNAFISGGGISPIPVRLVQPGGGGN